MFVVSSSNYRQFLWKYKGAFCGHRTVKLFLIGKLHGFTELDWVTKYTCGKIQALTTNKKPTTWISSVNSESWIDTFIGCSSFSLPPKKHSMTYYSKVLCKFYSISGRYFFSEHAFLVWSFDMQKSMMVERHMQHF